MAVILVTGTSSGIGLATAVALSRAGHAVFAGMRNPDRGSALREAVSKEHLPVTVLQLDVDDDSSVNGAVEQVLKKSGRIDVLINNAGIGDGGPVEEMPVAVFRQIMETNFFGSLRCIKAVLPGMRQRENGCIVNITSVAGRMGAAPQGAYTASKWALEGLSECLAQELRPFNIRVAIVEPGIIATPMTTTPRPAAPPGPYSTHQRRMAAWFVAALAKPASPFDVAATILGIVDGKTSKLRHPAGPDGNTMLQWRRNKTDEEWVDLGGASDAEWAAEIDKNLGLAVKL